MGFTQLAYNTEQIDIERLLQSCDRPGNYCVHSKLISTMPRLDVKGVGTVAFPVQTAQVRSLVAVAERAPYGRGPETVLDTSVRDCWQIDGAAFQVGGAGWGGAFGRILKQVAEGLGCPLERLDARPYKLLVYEPGGFFTAHRDTEKEAGMVGTLVVSLPTDGGGGELVVRHKDRESVIDLCVSDPSMLAYAAFYADCAHETRPVVEGHRVAVVFNLVLRGPAAAHLGRAPDFAEQAEIISTMLRTWVSKVRSGAKIVWLLDHDYSTAGLSFSALKGTDAVVARTLAAAAEPADCSLHAAIVRITEFGHGEFDWYDDEDDIEMFEVDDWTCSLEDWVALDDSRPDFGKIPLLDGELLPDQALADTDPDERRVQEASGNEGASVEHVYRKAALVVWPREKTVETLARGGILGAIDYVEPRLAPTRGPGVEAVSSLALGEQLLNAWADKDTRGWRYDPRREGLGRMLAVLRKISNPGLTLRFLTMSAAGDYTGTVNAELVAVAGQVGARGTASFLPGLVRSNIPKHPGDVLALLWQFNQTYCSPGNGDWREALAAASEAAFAALPHALNPPHDGERPWDRPKPKDLDERTICDLFSLAQQFGMESRAMDAVRLISKHPDLATPDRAIPRALARMRKRDASLRETRSYRALWRQASAFLLDRSGVPPEEPRDWHIEAGLNCNCRGCVQLQAFCDSPTINVTKIAVARPLRGHLRGKINSLKLDIEYTTESTGRPYKLVCRKNRRSYRQRLAQYAGDVHQMKVLLHTEPDWGMHVSRPPEMERLRTATARSHGSPA